MTEDEIIKKGFKVMLDARADIEIDNCCYLLRNRALLFGIISKETAEKLCEMLCALKGNR